MFTRNTGFVIVPIWLVAMGWLVKHDVWPGLVAQELPLVQASDWLAGEGNEVQYTISDELGPMGTVWTTYLVDEFSIRRDDVVLIDRLAMDLAPLRVKFSSTFTSDGLLDELTVNLENRMIKAKLEGERFHSAFSFIFSVGPTMKTFKVPLTDGRVFGGAFNPFSQLPDLHVGQRWRVQVFNPISAITGVGDRFSSMLVEVTEEVTILWAGKPQRCLVVESPSAKAWVDSRGEVLKQEAVLGLGGKITIVREPLFDEDALIKATQNRLYVR